MVLGFQQPFYEGLVQVIPVLILVVVVGELRLRAHPRRLSSFFVAVFVTAFMVFGELVSFAVLSSGKDTFLERVAVVLALVFGCLLLLMQFFVVLHDDVVRQTDPVMSISLWLAASLVVLIVVLAGGALIVLQGE